MRLPHGQHTPKRWYSLASIYWAISIRKSSLDFYHLFSIGKRYGVFILREDRTKEEDR